MIAAGLPISLLLGLSAVLLALLVGIPLGTLAALRQNSPTDYGIMGVAVLGIAQLRHRSAVRPDLRPLPALVAVAGPETGQLRSLLLPGDHAGLAGDRHRATRGNLPKCCATRPPAPGLPGGR